MNNRSKSHKVGSTGQMSNQLIKDLKMLGDFINRANH
jgi:hypothetical protein